MIGFMEMVVACTSVMALEVMLRVFQVSRKCFKECFQTSEISILRLKSLEVMLYNETCRIIKLIKIAATKQKRKYLLQIFVPSQ